MHAHRFRTFVLFAVCALLAGCTGAAAPTDSDVTAAVRALLQQQHLTFGAGHAVANAAPSGQATAVTVQNFGCNPAPDHRGYLCEIRITGGPSGGAQPPLNRLVRLVNTASGWQATMQ